MRSFLKYSIKKCFQYKFAKNCLESIYFYSGLKEEGKSLKPVKTLIPLDQQSMHGFNNEQTILFVTFEKSGTHWVKNLLGNYIHRYLNNDKTTMYDLTDIRGEYFKNKRRSGFGINKYKEPFGYKAHFSFEDIFFQHISTYNFDIHYSLGRKFFLVRNPLDALVSNYFYFDINKKLSIISYIDHYITRFARRYFYLNHIVKKNPENSSWIHFEELKRNTELILTKTLNAMGIPIDKDIVEYAIEQSSVKNIIKQEQNGRAITKRQSSHIRSNQIGEWKSHLKPKHVKKITTMLQEYNIKLTDFIIE